MAVSLAAIGLVLEFAAIVAPFFAGLLGEKGAKRNYERMMNERRAYAANFGDKYDNYMVKMKESMGAKTKQFKKDFETNLREGYAGAGFGLYGTPYMKTYSKFISDRLVPAQMELESNLEVNKLQALSQIMGGNLTAGETALGNVRQAEGDMWSSLAEMAGKLYESLDKPGSLKTLIEGITKESTEGTTGGTTEEAAEGTTKGRFKNLFTSEEFARYPKYHLQPKKSGI